MNESLLTIGALAKRAGVNIETVRYYQRRGLLVTPRKAPGGIRRYSPEAAQRIRFIKRAQSLRFTLDEVATLLELNDGKSCASTRQLAERKRGELNNRIAELESIRSALDQLIDACARKSNARPCPIIATLGSDATSV